ncbi:aminopeptidase [Paenibacillus pectinilyticus]|uniref:Aminopeptidase n=1 Tax=Paenibacillus pectinilyticus TaxID=512399 RepID=A0A1C1A2G0_9BACL|nr:M55 family metallopeptidase [Paenibacillus pectinilyticus]OCT14725.1 aminopeptidase [Paenibacillus pectinilyticus]
MKIYISADMEGISGVTNPDFLQPNEPNYEYGRRLMEHDVNAVIEAAIESGATEIVVADSHASGNNLRLDRLHPSATLVAGFPRDHYMMSGLTSDFSAVLFVGYHARHGMPGVLSHSYWFKNMTVNGMEVGEIGFNAIYAGLLGVPLALVTGDDHASEETKLIAPQAVTGIVKHALSRTSAICLSMEQSGILLSAKTKEAMERINDLVPFPINFPVEVRIEFFHSGQAELASSVSGVRRIPNSTIVEYKADDARTYYRTMEIMATLANTARFF